MMVMVLLLLLLLLLLLMMMIKMTEIHTHESRCIQCHLAIQVGHDPVRASA